MDEILDSLEFNSEENEEPINVSTVINNGIERMLKLLSSKIRGKIQWQI